VWVGWSALEGGASVRWLVGAAVVLLAWVYALQPYNFFLDRWHGFDRLLLGVLAGLTLWRPVFAFPFLLVLLPFIGQLEALPGYSWAVAAWPIRLTEAFVVFWGLGVLGMRLPLKDFVLFAGSLLGAHYFASGWGKLSLYWLLHDQVFYMLPATHANGWLAGLSPEAVAQWVETLRPLSAPVKVLVLLLEGGCVFFFAHRRAPVFFLGGWVLMHAGIFLVSGICFWLWSVLNLLLLWLFYRPGGWSALPLFRPRAAVLGAVLIVGGSWWFRPVRLAWADAPLSYTYRFEGQSPDGRTQTLPPEFFAPYDYQFTLGGFGYLCPEPLLGVVWGATDELTVRRLEAIQEAESFFAHEARFGRVYFDAPSAERFDAFLRRFAGGWNAAPRRGGVLHRVKAPRLLWTFPRGRVVQPSFRLAKIRVVQLTTWYRGGRYEVLRRRVVREVSIP